MASCYISLLIYREVVLFRFIVVYFYRSCYIKHLDALETENQNVLGGCFLSLKKLKGFLVYQRSKELVGLNTKFLQRVVNILGFSMRLRLMELPKLFFPQFSEVLSVRSIYLTSLLANKRKNAFDMAFRLGLVRALRRRRGLPVRGQRTKTNANTSRRLKFGRQTSK